MGATPIVIYISLYNYVVLLNQDLGISSQQGWVSFVSIYYFIGFSPIPLDDLSISSPFNPLVSGSTILSFDLHNNQ